MGDDLHGRGFLFGNVPIIKDNFTLVTIGIVFVSVLPMVFEVLKHRRNAGASQAQIRRSGVRERQFS